jgi:Nif-specific regulatory protein
LARAILFCRSTFERAAALKQENQGLSERLAHHFRPAGMVGDSDKMQAVYERIVHVAPTELPVLIRGEKGTGKKDVARALHEGSFRRGRALVKVDCASLPETTVEAHAGGDPAPGISGALLMLSGCLKMAQGGTLLLDHVDRLSATAQARLLRVIQKKEFEQTGSMESFSCDVRIIGATSAPLEELVDSGEFRRDFFQALVACSVRLPALCERRDDILQLTQHFLDQFAARHRKKIQRVSPAVVDLLLAYDWPGNVGELCTCLEKAVLLCGDGVLRANHFPPRLYACVDPQGTEAGLLDSAIAALEHDMVVDALTLHRGNISAAARQLGTTERIMGCRIKKYGLDMKRFAGMQAEALPA